ncbi:aldose epimerase family protein [Alicyclobacillus dauci]|uniref:Aldose epimerase n=1 Tax=Alicyclobacillus dauci TaxID=1475485 RepID=A0ABY6Z161_9BACL|nr:aldose epimerase [Alicyclobacillus dauci]WAH36475.1 aldose epimerase [Alicyclobacillus dauci]
MYIVREFVDKFKMVELKNEANNSWVHICPHRGGIVTSFGVEGKDLLYLDKTTFYDESANIRGGNPILFPVCGQLLDGHYEIEGVSYRLKNHGFARNKPWQVIDTVADEDKASVTLRLQSDGETKAVYPFDFELEFEYVLMDNQLIMNQKYTNSGETTMPMYAGFHPYFPTTEKDLAYETDATSYLDYNDMVEKPYEGHIDLAPLVESVALMDTKVRRIGFQPPGYDKKIVLEYGDVFTNVQIWSVQGKDFVCVEPWMARTYAMNTGEGLVHVEPHQTLDTHLTIRYGN